MLIKKSIIEQPFVPYNQHYNACFINYEKNPPKIAEGVALTGLVDCAGGVTIEKDVFFGHGVKILTSLHDYTKFGEERKTTGLTKPVYIKQGAWIASFAIILPGVTIGEHSVVAAGSVVIKDVLPYTVVAGNPAKRIKEIEHKS